MTEKRLKETCCPTHGIDMRARQDNTIICLVYGCNWQTPARRETDKEIESVQKIADLWHDI